MKKWLINHPLFQGWGQVELKALLAESTQVVLEAGERVFSRGDTSTSLYVIDEGKVQLQLTSPQGVVRKLKALGAGESIGDTYVLMDKPYRVDAVALSVVRMLKIPKRVFFEHLAQQPILMRSLIATLSERLFYLLGDVLTVTLHSGTQRAICYLLDDSLLRNGVRITLKSSKAQIAASLNLTPEHFSRILNDLSSRGFIAVEGRHIEFLDVDGLCAYER